MCMCEMVPSELKCQTECTQVSTGVLVCPPERENSCSIWCWQLRFLLQEHVNSLQQGKKMHFERWVSSVDVFLGAFLGIKIWYLRFGKSKGTRSTSGAGDLRGRRCGSSTAHVKSETPPVPPGFYGTPRTWTLGRHLWPRRFQCSSFDHIDVFG